MRYKIFHNVAMMQLIPYLPFCTVSEKLDDGNSLYPISDYTIRVGFFRYVLLKFNTFFSSFFHKILVGR